MSWGGDEITVRLDAPVCSSRDLRVAEEHVDFGDIKRDLLSDAKVEWRLVRAYCMDDSGNPHPASRPDPDERVTPDFDGEIFRCVAGTALQATLGWREDGEDRFDGVSIQCQKGEALRYGHGGELFCAPQEHRRNCNERSLLRLHGPGVKLIWYRYEEHYTETVERRSERYERSSMTLMLDGGVGGYH